MSKRAQHDPEVPGQLTSLINVTARAVQSVRELHSCP